MNEDASRQKSKHQKVSLYKKTQDYDLLLLLQSMSEIRLHAQRFYQDGLEKFLRKEKRRHEPAVLAEYRLNCVCQAQEYAKCLLKANHQRERADLYANLRHTRSKPLRLKRRFSRTS